MTLGQVFSILQNLLPFVLLLILRLCGMAWELFLFN